jgi:hypothetical protein
MRVLGVRRGTYRTAALLGYGAKDKFKIVQPRIDRASGPPLEKAGPRGLSRLNFVLVLVPGGWFAFKIGRRGRRFFSDTGDQREKKHDEARYDKHGPHKDN